MSSLTLWPVAVAAAILLDGTALVASTQIRQLDRAMITLLRLIDRGELDASAVAKAIHNCASPEEGGRPSCSGVAEALREFAAQSQPARTTVEDGIRRAAEAAEGREKSVVAEVKERVTRATPSAEEAHAGISKANRTEPTTPPSASELARLPQWLANERLFAYLEGFLPRDRDDRVQRLFEAATSQSCTTVYDGKVSALCEGLGLWRLQWASLSLAIRDIRDSKGDPGVVGSFLKLDPKLRDAGLVKGETSTDVDLATHMQLIRAWAGARPTRWGAWADIETMLGSRS
jgi:hypothetical protein